MFNSPRMNHLDVDPVVKKLRAAQSILLTTHKQCDGDGLGALLGLYHALRKSGKTVRAMCVDDVPKKYRFLEPEKYVEIFEKPHTPLEKMDLVLIFDTNDRRLVEPLYTKLESVAKEILFVDHHPVLNQGPVPTSGSFVDVRASSTGEISYFLIRALGIHLDETIARALYTSICFDTQLFKFVRNSPTSHLICAELLGFVKNTEEVHRHLFATHTIDKIAFLSKVLGEIEYYNEGRLAILKLKAKDLLAHNLDMDDSRDVIDMIMNINSLQAAALFREDAPNEYKLSLRSKGQIEVLGIAEHFGGGGHMYAAGASLKFPYDQIKTQIVDQLLRRMESLSSPKENVKKKQ